MDITEGVSASSQSQFNWPNFVKGRSWFPQYFDHDIRHFEVVWHYEKKQAVFLVTKAGGEKFTVNPRARHQDKELSRGTDGISEV